MTDVSPMLIAALLSPTVIVSVVGALLKRAITNMDAQIVALQAEVKAIGGSVAKRDVDCARCSSGFEQRIHALERDAFRRE